MSDEDEGDEKVSPSKNNVAANSDTDFSDEDLSQEQKNTLAISGMLKRILDADRKRAAIAAETTP